MFKNPKLQTKNKKLIFFVSFIFLSTLYFLLSTSLIGCSPNQTQKAAKGKAVYYCPMHPTYTSDKPGDCPICNMKLVKRETAPKKVSEHKRTPGVSSSQQQLTKEKTLEEVCIEHNCTMKDCPMKIRATLSPGEKIVCPVCGEVISTTTGKVVEIAKPQTQIEAPVKKERKILFYRNPMNPESTSPVPMKDSMGMDYIPVYEEESLSGPTVMISPEKQQLIGVKTQSLKNIPLTKAIRASGKIAYDPELAIAQEEFIQALNNEERTKDSPLQEVIERAESLTQAARRKLQLLGMSDEQITQLQNSKKADTSLYLPVKGENVWAYLSIYEYEIGLVKTGLLVEIEAVAYPGETFEGKVISISPVLDPQSRTNQVRVEVVNKENKLKPEMFVNAKINVDLGKKLALPETAVMDTGLRKIVYLSKEGGLLEARQVQLGQKAEGYYEVLGGLSEGDIVVTSGNFFIDSESKLKSALEE